MRYVIFFVLLFCQCKVCFANANSFEPSPGFLKLQQSLDYAELHMIRERATDALDALERLRYLVVINPRLTGVADTPELQKRLENLKEMVDSGKLSEALNDPTLEKQLLRSWRGETLEKLALVLPWPFCELFDDCP
jgi:hypothetical protein